MKIREMNTSRSLEASLTEQKLDRIIQSQPIDANPTESTETDFNLKLLYDGTLFSSYTINTLSLIGLEQSNNNYNNNYEIYQNQQPINSNTSVKRTKHYFFQFYLV